MAGERTTTRTAFGQLGTWRPRPILVFVQQLEIGWFGPYQERAETARKGENKKLGSSERLPPLGKLGNALLDGGLTPSFLYEAHEPRGWWAGNARRHPHVSSDRTALASSFACMS